MILLLPRKNLMQTSETDIVYRLEKRAEIRRNIATRKSVQENKPDRIADLLEEAAGIIKQLRVDGCQLCNLQNNHRDI